MAFCTRCGASLDGQPFCSGCGRPISNAEDTIVRSPSAGMTDETATGLPVVMPVHSQPTQPLALPRLPTLQPDIPQIPRAPRRARNPWLIVLALLVMVLLGLVAFIVTRAASA